MTFLSEQFARCPREDGRSSFSLRVWQVSGESFYHAAASNCGAHGATPEEALEKAVDHYLESCAIIAEERRNKS